MRTCWDEWRRLLNTPRGGPPPPHPFVLGRCGRALDSWRSWRSWCLCLQMWKPSDSRQTFCDSANSHLFRRIDSTNMGEIAGGTSGGSTVSILKKHPPLLLIFWTPIRDGTGKPFINFSGPRSGREPGKLIIISDAERRDGKQILTWRGGARDG